MKKKEKKEMTCPMWLATYGDMVTNIIVFFVLLLSMSEIKKEERFIEFMQAIREAFGYVGGYQQLPLDQQLEVKNVDLAQMLIIPIRPHEMSESPDPGVKGKESAVTHIRRGRRFADGGKYYFAELSSELSEENEKLVTHYADKLRGYRTQLEIRAHCNPRPADEAGHEDHFDLSLARARAVADAFVRHGIDPARLILIGAGANEPVVTGAYTVAQRQENDRVEVFQVNKHIDEFGSDPPPPELNPNVRASEPGEP